MTLLKVSGPVAWMVGASAASCLVLVVATGSTLMPELLLGLAGPLASAVVSWQLIERTQVSAPERLTSVLMTAFAVKALFFALYVVMVLGVAGLRPTPFILSFTGYYVGLHVVEAMFLKRLLADGASRWPGEGRLS
jgi:hypothetical protein